MFKPKSLESFEFKFISASRYRRSIYSPYLTIVLHGRGDDLRSFRQIDRELKIPGMNYLLINAPRKYEDGYTWYGFPPRQANGVLNSRRRLNLLMGELEALGWRSENIFLLGHSQGSLVTCDYAMTTERQLGGFIGVSGYVYFFENWKGQVSDRAFSQNWLVTHGLKDDLLPIEETRESIRTLSQNGLPVEWAEFNKGHFMECAPENRFISRWIQSYMHPVVLSSRTKVPIASYERTKAQVART